MPWRRLDAGVVSLLAILALAVLLFGADRLETRLPGGLPLGNALAAASLILFACAAVLVSALSPALRGFSIGALALAVLWLPVSILLAGNLDLNFDGAAGGTWLAFTAVVTVASLGAFLLALARSLLRGRASGRGKFVQPKDPA